MQRAWAGWASIVLAVGGCGGPRAAPEALPVEADGGAAIKSRDVGSLPPVGDYLAPLDGGRLEVAPPAGWNVLPRSRTWLAGFAKGKSNELPRIVLNASDPPPDAPTNLTEENAAALAAAQDAELRAAKKLVEEPSLPIALGEHLFVRHVRRAQLRGTPVVVQSLETIQNGRHYTIELFAEIESPRAEEYQPSLLKWRDLGYAVAAHLRFAKPGETFDPLTDALESRAAAKKTAPPSPTSPAKSPDPAPPDAAP